MGKSSAEELCEIKKAKVNCALIIKRWIQSQGCGSFGVWNNKGVISTLSS